jgi:hypothetical protein
MLDFVFTFYGFTNFTTKLKRKKLKAENIPGALSGSKRCLLL